MVSANADAPAAKPKGRAPRKAPAAKVSLVQTPSFVMLKKKMNILYSLKQVQILTLQCLQPKKKPVVDEDDSDDEIMDLKDRLAAYNLDTSPENSAGNFCFTSSKFGFQEISGIH